MDTPQIPPPKPSNRGLFRWLLAAFVLVVMVTVIAVAMPYYRDHQAAQRWEKLGGVIQWSDWLSEISDPKGKSVSRRIEELFHHVRVADYAHGNHELKELLPIVRDFRELNALLLYDVPATAEDIRMVAIYQPRLKALMFEMCSLSDDGIREIRNFTQLEELLLSDPNITDESLAHLGQLKKLRTLNLSRTDITDDGLWHLRTLKNLRELDLSNTLVTDEGVERLRAEIPDLEVWDD